VQHKCIHYLRRLWESFRLLALRIHGSIWRILRHYGIPPKIIEIIKLLYERFELKVVHGGKLSNVFTIQTGVRQGCLLLPLLFTIVLDWMTRRAYEDAATVGKQWTPFMKLESLEYADYLGMLSQRALRMRQKTTRTSHRTVFASPQLFPPYVHKWMKRIRSNQVRLFSS
jgi:hypothetical protein